MKNRVRRGAARLKRVYTEPWTVRSAQLNVLIWSAVMLLGLGNFAIGLLAGGNVRAFWAGFSIVVLLFDATMLKWSLTGLFWRKAQEELAREEALITEAFYAMVIDEYKHP